MTFNINSVKILFNQRCLQIGNSDIRRRAPASCENLIDRVKRFLQLDPTDFALCRINEGTGIIQLGTSNNAFCHKGCYDNFNDSHY